MEEHEKTVMDAIVYRCPHCSATIEVESPTDKDVLMCPNEDCARPFELQMPRAQIVGKPDLDARVATSGFQIRDKDALSERTLLEIHPAMFRRHPVYYSLVVLMGVSGVAVSIYFAVVEETRTMAFAGLVLFAAALCVLAIWWLDTRFKTLTITNKRALMRTGLLAKNTTEVRHEDAKNLQVEQSFTERIFGVGDIAISSAGQDDLEIVMRGVPRPDEVARIVRQQQA